LTTADTRIDYLEIDPPLGTGWRPRPADDAVAGSQYEQIELLLAAASGYRTSRQGTMQVSRPQSWLICAQRCRRR